MLLLVKLKSKFLIIQRNYSFDLGKYFLTSPNLNDIITTKLSQFSVEGGNVLHAITEDEIGYIRFGEVYFSYINPGAVKAWKLHRRMTLNLVVPLGNVRFVFCDPHTEGQYRVEEIGETNYVRLTVPPNIWFGFQGASSQPSLIANIADLKHDQNEVNRKGIAEFCYDW